MTHSHTIPQMPFYAHSVNAPKNDMHRRTKKKFCVPTHGTHSSINTPAHFLSLISLFHIHYTLPITNSTHKHTQKYKHACLWAYTHFIQRVQEVVLPTRRWLRMSIHFNHCPVKLDQNVPQQVKLFQLAQKVKSLLMIDTYCFPRWGNSRWWFPETRNGQPALWPHCWYCQ